MNDTYSQSIRVDTIHNEIQNTVGNENWLYLTNKLKELKISATGNVTIVHIGDSHIQGGYLTNTVRSQLYKDYGVADRGWVFPYSLVHSNGPEDLHFDSNAKWSFSKYNRILPFHKTGISGYVLESNDSVINLSVALRLDSRSLVPFDELDIVYLSSGISINASLPCSIETEDAFPDVLITRFKFQQDLDSVSLMINSSKKKFQLLGFDLVHHKPGIRYHELGINGIGYETFDQMIDYLPYLRMLRPDCLIISLGTNDANMQRMDTTVIKRHIHSILTSLKNTFPSACLILTTPGDYLLRRNYLNPNLLLMHDLVISMARQEQCVFWDFFNTMGGLGSSRKWSRNGLFYKDMLHLSKRGYRYQGELLYMALKKTLEQTPNDK